MAAIPSIYTKLTKLLHYGDVAATQAPPLSVLNALRKGMGREQAKFLLQRLSEPDVGLAEIEATFKLPPIVQPLVAKLKTPPVNAGPNTWDFPTPGGPAAPSPAPAPTPGVAAAAGSVPAKAVATITNGPHMPAAPAEDLVPLERGTPAVTQSLAEQFKVSQAKIGADVAAAPTLIDAKAQKLIDKAVERGTKAMGGSVPKAMGAAATDEAIVEGLKRAMPNATPEMLEAAAKAGKGGMLDRAWKWVSKNKAGGTNWGRMATSALIGYMVWNLASKLLDKGVESAYPNTSAAGQMAMQNRIASAQGAAQLAAAPSVSQMIMQAMGPQQMAQSQQQLAAAQGGAYGGLPDMRWE